MTMCDPQTLERRVNSGVKAINLFLAQRTGVLTTGPITIAPNQGVIIITAGSANASNVSFPNPVLYPGRTIQVANYSTNSQNLLSHDGTTLVFRVVSSGALLATTALETASSPTTGHREFKASNGVWYQVGA